MATNERIENDMPQSATIAAAAAAAIGACNDCVP